MAVMTLLEMTQDILNDMDSDSVNSIDDTVESLQVAAIVKTAYFKLVTARDDWPFLRTFTTLTALADVANPTKMRFPTGMNKIYWVKYNGDDITYCTPKEFRDLIDAREELADVVDSSGYVLNRDPVHWTTYDDDYVYFDGYDEDTDSTLQASKSSVYGILVPSWTAIDSFTPTLPPKMFPTLLADAKGTAFLVLKQQANPKEEDYALRGRVRFQSAAYKADNAEPAYNTAIDYSRRR